MYIYADILFVINVVMNSVILMLTAWTVGFTYKIWRIMLAAIAGSCYVLVGMLPMMEFCHTVIVKLVVAWLLICIAFGYQSKRTSVLLLASFYIVSFILGGSIVGWLYFWQTNNYSHNLVIHFSNVSWRNVIWGTCLGIILIVSMMRRMLSKMTRQQHLYQVRIEYDGQVAEFTAMLDTGNGLYTTVDHKPVVLVSQYAVESILSEDVVTFLQNNVPEMWLVNLDQCTDEKWLSRTQIIPYRSIGSHSMLLAFRADALSVLSAAGMTKIPNVIIGIYSRDLSEDRAYAGLLHPQIINEVYKKEGASICA